MRRPAKAFLLAAGLGTRLKPLTDKTPKCLLPLGGRPLLYWWLKIARDLGVREALVNTHHLAGQVEAFAAAWRGAPRLRLFHEPELLGSAGTIAANAAFVAGQEAFWIFYADTLVAADISPLWELHAARKPMLTVGLFRPPDPKACGVVEIAGDGRVLSFEEKPARPKSDLAAVGVYIAGPELLPRLPLPGDLGKDVLPGLEANVYGKLLDGPAIDIGTPATYERARSRWKELGLDRRLEVKR